MPDIEEMRDELSHIEGEIKLLEIKSRLINAKIAETSCPFNVGDRVTDGKYEYEISQINPKYRRPYWALRGCKIKKDGTPGKLETQIYDFRQKIVLVSDQ